MIHAKWAALKGSTEYLHPHKVQHMFSDPKSGCVHMRVMQQNREREN